MAQKQETFWFFYHQQQKRWIRGLTLSEARAFVSAMNASEKPFWHVWRTGWSSWHELEEIVELQQPVRRNVAIQPPPPPTEPVEDDTLAKEMKAVMVSHRFEDGQAPRSHQQQDGGDTKGGEARADKKGEFVRRAYRRYQKRLRVDVECAGRRFTSYSQDVSVGGVQLETPVPDWVVGYFLVILTNEQNQESIELTCSVVDNQSPESRLRLEFSPMTTDAAKNDLDAWLMAA